jgi:thymidylate synthase (FAD)
MIKKLQVLDKGHVEYIDHMGNDLTVVNAARVSFNKESSWEHTDSGFPNKFLSEKDKKLISYLAKHNHWTPFAHTQITLRIKAPIFVRAQLGKHQVGFVMNEVSRRYVTDKPELYIPRWRSAPTNNVKQGSSGFMSPNPYVIEMYENLCDDSLEVYEELLKQGIAPEQARAVLPQAMYTEWWWTGSLSAYFRVFIQRIDSHAQWEVQQYAEAFKEIISPLFPISWNALIGETKYETTKEQYE